MTQILSLSHPAAYKAHQRDLAATGKSFFVLRNLDEDLRQATANDAQPELFIVDFGALHSLMAVYQRSAAEALLSDGPTLFFLPHVPVVIVGDEGPVSRVPSVRDLNIVHYLSVWKQTEDNFRRIAQALDGAKLCGEGKVTPELFRQCWEALDPAKARAVDLTRPAGRPSAQFKTPKR